MHSIYFVSEERQIYVTIWGGFFCFFFNCVYWIDFLLNMSKIGKSFHLYMELFTYLWFCGEIDSNSTPYIGTNVCYTSYELKFSWT